MAEIRLLAIGVALPDAVRALADDARAEATLAAGLRALAEGPWTATILSLDLIADDDELIRRVAREPKTGALVLAAAAPSLRMALAAPSLGAADLLTLPLRADEVARVLRAGEGSADAIPLPDVPDGDDEVVGSSPALVEVFKTVGRVGPSDATVLVTGESGTGKELIARAVHRVSARAGGPFVAVNCAAIPEDLLESELFGHEKGAFTGAVARKIGRFERAGGGTLFLDEIGDMSLVLQAKILRAVQEREIERLGGGAVQEREIERLGGEERIALDVRVVTATHRDLPALIASGDFREDLYYRLAVVRLHLPPLRERPGDLRPLALHYAARFARAYGRPVRAMSEGAMERLASHRWPGNIRELRNALERAVLIAPGEVVLPEHVDLGAAPPGEAQGIALPGYSPTLSFAEMEALHLRQVLEHAEGQIGRAAEILGVHRNTVTRKALEYGILPG